MNDFNQKIELIHAYADGELSETETLQAVSIVQSDQYFSLEYLSVQSLKQKLGDQPDCDVPKNGWNQCKRRIADLDRSKKVERTVSRYSWALCAVVFVSIVSGSAIHHFDIGRKFGTSDMPRALSGLEADPSFSTSSLGSWLKSKLGSAPMTSPQKVKVVEGVSGLIDGHPSVRLTLSDDSGLSSLYIISGENAIHGVRPIAPGSAFSTGTVGDLNCVTWMDHGYDMMLVSPRSAAQLYSLAKTVCPIRK